MLTSASSAPRGLVSSRRGVAETIAERVQLGLGNRRFDQREHLSFLELDVLGEAFTEVVKQLERGFACGSVGVAADQHVILEHARHSGVSGVAVGCEGGQQKLFLEAKVLLALGLPVSEEGTGGFGRVLAGRAAELLGDDEHVVMLARERNQSAMALHDGCKSASPGPVAEGRSITEKEFCTVVL